MEGLEVEEALRAGALGIVTVVWMMKERELEDARVDLVNK